MLWITGMPGAGKSAIARTLVDSLKQDLRLGSNFFFTRADADRCTPLALWCHILYALSSKYQKFRNAALSAIRDPSFQLGSAKPDTIVDIIVKTLQSLLETDIPHGQRPVIVIDGLDECRQYSRLLTRERSAILRGLTRLRDINGPDFKIIITSRHEEDIRSVLEHDRVGRIHLSAGILVDADADADIDRFFQFFFKGELKNAGATDEQIEALVDQSAGLFIWAKTAVDFIRDRRGFAHHRLAKLIREGLGGEKGDLGTLYHLVLSDQFTDTPDDGTRAQFLRVVGTMLAATTPLTRQQLMGLLLAADEEMETCIVDEWAILEILQRLSTVLAVTGDTSESRSDEVLQFAHLSFVDYLLDIGNTGKFYGIDLTAAHTWMGIQCLAVRNLDVRHKARRIPPKRGDSQPSIPRLSEDRVRVAAQYANPHWATHAAKMDLTPDVKSRVDALIQRQIGSWNEVRATLGLNVESLMQAQTIQSWDEADQHEELR